MGLSKEDRKMARGISDIIEGLDKLIFPKKPIPVFVIDNIIIRDENERFRYCATTSSEFRKIIQHKGEFYLIFGIGLNRRIKKDQRKRVMLFSGEDRFRESREFPFFSLKGILFTIASHEVRHRIFFHYPERAFSPLQIRYIHNEDLKALFLYVYQLSSVIYKEDTNSPRFRREFDAAIIEHVVAEKYYRGVRDIIEISKIISAGSIAELENYWKKIN